MLDNLTRTPPSKKEQAPSIVSKIDDKKNQNQRNLKQKKKQYRQESNHSRTYGYPKKKGSTSRDKNQKPPSTPKLQVEQQVCKGKKGA